MDPVAHKTASQQRYISASSSQQRLLPSLEEITLVQAIPMYSCQICKFRRRQLESNFFLILIDRTW